MSLSRPEYEMNLVDLIPVTCTFHQLTHMHGYATIQAKCKAEVEKAKAAVAAAGQRAQEWQAQSLAAAAAEERAATAISVSSENNRCAYLVLVFCVRSHLCLTFCHTFFSVLFLID